MMTTHIINGINLEFRVLDIPNRAIALAVPCLLVADYFASQPFPHGRYEVHELT